MHSLTRRSFVAAAGATAACSTGTGSNARDKIDANVAHALQKMERQHPFTTALTQNAAGILVMPRIAKAGFMIGGAYGEGSLLIGRAPVDYYSTLAASFGFQIGGQVLSSVLFFMNNQVLSNFRSRDGWTLGADLEFVVIETGEAVGVDTNTYKDPIYAIVFGQKGLIIGASLQGSKYSRIIR